MKTILVVDDEEHIRELATLYLDKEGYGVLTASDGEEALEVAREQQPDLIVLDVMMPRMDGLDACRELRKESDVPVLMLTARSEEIDRIVGLELGADDYMAKPFNPRELTARIKAILRRSEGAQTPDRLSSLGAADGGLAAPRGDVGWRFDHVAQQGIRTAAGAGQARGAGAEPRAVAGTGLGLRLLRRDAHGGCAREPGSPQAGGEQRSTQTVRGVGYKLVHVPA